MAVYAYTAMLRGGAQITGTEAAADADEVALRLHERSALPLRIDLALPAQKPFWTRLPLLASGHRRETLVATSEICTLITAGLTVDRALTIVLERTPAAELREVLTRVRDSVRGGKALADAVEAEPAVFSPVYVALVRAGELSGHLGDALGHLSAYMARGDAFRAQLQSALIYPAILLAAGTAALLLLSNLVLPQFVSMFADAGKMLPLPTRVVLAGNRVLGASWPSLMILAVLGVVAVRRMLTVPAMRIRLHGIALTWPVFGALWRNIEAARLARTMGALLQSGVSVPAALVLALQVLSNAAMQRGGLQALDRIREGAAVSEAMLRSRVLPEISIQLLAVGEETGRLDTMLFKQADLLEEASARRISTLLALLVPGLTIGIGVFVGAVMIAVMMAVLQLNEVVG